MLSSISPVGEASRGQPWLITALAYTSASAAAGAAVGGLLGAAGHALGQVATATGRLRPDAVPVRTVQTDSAPGDTVLDDTVLGDAVLSDTQVLRAALILLAFVAIAGLVLDATKRVPGPHRQVDRKWLTRYRGWVYGLGFGAQLGTGVVTVIPASVVWVMWAAALLTTAPLAGAIIGGTFGLLRAAPVLASGVLTDVAALRRTLAGMERLRRPAARVTIAGQVGVVLTAVAALTW